MVAELQRDSRAGKEDEAAAVEDRSVAGGVGPAEQSTGECQGVEVAEGGRPESRFGIVFGRDKGTSVYGGALTLELSTVFEIGKSLFISNFNSLAFTFHN